MQTTSETGSILTVTKFDRFARNMTEACQILTDLSQRGVLFGLGAAIHDWNDPFGRLFLQTLAMAADYAPAKAWPSPNAKANSAP